MYGARFLKTDIGDTCFVTVSGRTNYIPAHEGLHLFDVEHSPQRWNLMYEAIPANYIWNDPRAIKRLEPFQEWIMNNAFELEIDL